MTRDFHCGYRPALQTPPSGPVKPGPTGPGPLSPGPLRPRRPADPR
ncbi:hypothetical protein [Kutzneria albida]|uniref:Uncharacterized protein n=1 Tax=Kutzneria albida DSM 43870 TaxID=1449976 RepID=W5WGG5_9PSEU|nr:hypothetical protein [Kutzneria albida]AHI00289.1 hypothetical protein KALB_6930 [Kutzneria albida DSM 43870]